MARPRIVYTLRKSARTKPGGDSGKIGRYARGLRVRGFDTRVAYSIGDLARTRPRIVHLSNIDLVLENYAYSRWCVKNSVPYVISTIHHDGASVEAYYRRGRGNLFNSALKRCGLSFDNAAVLRERVSGVLHGRAGQVVAGIGLRMSEMQEYVLRHAARVYPMAVGESHSLEADICGVQDRSRIIFNPFTFLDALRSDTTSPRGRAGILCVGRIEPRKNQVEIMEALKGVGIEVTFVGMVNGNHPAYWRRCQSLLRSEPAFRHVPHVSHEVLVQYYRRAKLHVSLSWFEVVSQVDLEALSHGCHILPTKSGFVREYLSGACSEYDPLAEYGAIDVIREKILTAYRRDCFPSVKENLLVSWEHVMDMLDEEYRKHV